MSDYNKYYNLGSLQGDFTDENDHIITLKALEQKVGCNKL